MTQKNEDSSRFSAGSLPEYDEKRKLAELRALILSKGDLERDHILEQARSDAEKWISDQTVRLETTIADIKADAVKRSQDMTSRLLAEAEAERDKSRLRLQNELLTGALARFQEALIAFPLRADYGDILAGVALEIFPRLPEGEKILLRLRAEDASYGQQVVDFLLRHFPKAEVVFDAAPAPISGGVYLCSEGDKWRAVADWKSKVDDMADAVAKTVLAEL